ncbi:three-Cys-motif partner protein TcmP [Deinococcus ficus]|uniref:Three-Cys-motif partner protein TcmP n=1 Tax=Deinococcus ficus TaxID=317577 RepID=A0A221SYL4_9DEIO|nr:three-Cys-motif partner protein TcmP [Deinococcus ficus]ASN81745.1 hypothetical protein DFI_12765 [Deinococcus ficus]
MTHRRGHVWTASKLDFLEKYLPAFQRVCKQWWRENEGHANTYYVDGFAGSGRNDFGEESRLGSPLVALSITPAFKRYFLVEWKSKNVKLLEQELAHPDFDQLRPRVDLCHGDINSEIDRILHSIRDGHPTFFFLDPEGMELEWRTVEKIGQRQRADLFILISASGAVRGASPDRPDMHERITSFYGHERWREIAERDRIPGRSGQQAFEDYLTLYLEGLRGLGFTHVDKFLIASNSKNVAMHGLVFAAKNDVAIKIATSQIEKLIKARKGTQPTLF